MAGHTC